MQPQLSQTIAPAAARTVPIAPAPVTEAPPRHRWPVLHLASQALGLAMRLVPRRWRFRAAMLLSRVLAPVVRRTSVYREQRGQCVDGLREITLYRVLESLAVSGTLYDPVLRCEGMEHLEAAVRAGKGVLLAGPHTMLSTIVVRMVRDRGWEQMVLSASPMFVSGTREVMPYLAPSPIFLIAVRRLLLRGTLVSGMLDRGEEHDRRVIRFHTDRGAMQVADALIPLALRCGARVVFLATRVEGGEVVVRFAPPSPDSVTADEVTGDFVAFVQAHVAARAARDRRPAPVAIAAPTPAAAAG